MDETFTELTKAFRSVSKLIKEKTEDYFGHLTPLDKALREVSDENSCTISNSLLRDLANAANTGHAYAAIMQCVWTGITADAWQWRRIYKCLLLLEFLILSGPESVQSDCSGAAMLLRNLCNFRFFEGAREEGGGVRQRASRILDLLEKPEVLQEAREAAIAYAQRYSGIECPFHAAAASNPFSFSGSNPRSDQRQFGGLRGALPNPFASPPFGRPTLNQSTAAAPQNNNPFLSGPAAAARPPPSISRRPTNNNPFYSNNGGSRVTPLPKSYDAPSSFAAFEAPATAADSANPFESIDEFQTSADPEQVWGQGVNNPIATNTLLNGSSYNKQVKNATRPSQNDHPRCNTPGEKGPNTQRLPDLFSDQPATAAAAADFGLEQIESVSKPPAVTKDAVMGNSHTKHCNLLDLDEDDQSFEL